MATESVPEAPTKADLASAIKAFVEKKTRDEQRQVRDEDMRRLQETGKRARIYLTEEDRQKAHAIVAEADKVKQNKLPFILAYAAASSVVIEPKNATKLVSAAQALLTKAGFVDALLLRERLAGSTSEHIMASFRECLLYMQEIGAEIDVDHIVEDTNKQIQEQLPQMPVAPEPPKIMVKEALTKYQTDLADFQTKLAEYISAQSGVSVIDLKDSVSNAVGLVLVQAAASVMAAAETEEMMDKLEAFLFKFHKRYPLLLECPPSRSPIVENSVRALYG